MSHATPPGADGRFVTWLNNMCHRPPLHRTASSLAPADGSATMGLERSPQSTAGRPDPATMQAWASPAASWPTVRAGADGDDADRSDAQAVPTGTAVASVTATTRPRPTRERTGAVRITAGDDRRRRRPLVPPTRPPR